jgi:hypothetical protein
MVDCDVTTANVPENYTPQQITVSCGQKVELSLHICVLLKPLLFQIGAYPRVYQYRCKR